MKALLDGACARLAKDAVAEKSNVVELLSSAMTLLGDTNAAAQAMIESAKLLVEVDPAGNAAAVQTVLITAKALL